MTTIEFAAKEYAKANKLSTEWANDIGDRLLNIKFIDGAGKTVEIWDVDNITSWHCRKLPHADPVEFGYQLINVVGDEGNATEKDLPQALYKQYTRCANVKPAQYLKAYYAAYHK